MLPSPPALVMMATGMVFRCPSTSTTGERAIIPSMLEPMDTSASVLSQLRQATLHHRKCQIPRHRITWSPDVLQTLSGDLGAWSPATLPELPLTAYSWSISMEVQAGDSTMSEQPL